MKTNFVKLTNLTLRKSLNHIGLRAVLMVLLVALGVGEMWAAKTYNSQLTVKVNSSDTGKGYVYAATESGATVAYGESTTAGPLSSSTSGQADTYYAWVEAVRGAEFKSWTEDKINSLTAPSGANKYYTITVKEATSDKGTNTGTLTATWTTYTAVNVTYNKPTDGSYNVKYQYKEYDSSSKTISTVVGIEKNLTEESSAQTVSSYHNDVITLTSTSGTLLGWYSNEARTTELTGITNNGDGTYTYVAPESGSVSVYPKYKPEDKYYGKVTASIAPVSMPGGGTIFVSANEGLTDATFSDEPQSAMKTTFGTTSQTLYLHAQPTDKRYVFRGWFNNADCTGAALSTNADYNYPLTATSTTEASPTTATVYACFEYNLYYLQVDVEPATLGLGMVLVKDNNTTTPDYTEYTNASSLLTYMYRGASTKNVYLYAKPKYGYKFSGWYDNEACSGTAKSTSNPYTYAATGSSTDPFSPTITTLYAKFVEDATTINITYNLPDRAKGEYTASVLDVLEIDDEYVWGFTEVFTSVGKTDNTVQAQHKTDVLKLEAAPKAGYGVTSWTEGGTTKTTPEQVYKTAGSSAKTLGVAFGDAKPFMVSANNATTGTQYATLAEALANRGSNTKITVVQNAYVETGNYTIPNGVTLLIPYESGYSITTLAAENKTWAARSEFRRLTLAEGANITIANGGAICLAGQQYGTSSGNPGPGSVLGAYSVLDMSKGGHITVSNGGNFYAYGYVVGKGDQSTSGTITVQSGGKVYECLAINDMHGGGGSAACVNGTTANNDYGLFPFNQYYVQNVEPKMTIEAGGFVYGAYDIAASGLGKHDHANIIGNSSDYLFQVTSGSIIKWYDVTTDYQCYEVRGSISMNKIKVSASGSIALESSKFVLPVTNNMNIRVSSGATLELPYAIKLLPGTIMVIDEGAVANIKNEFYVYDYQDWDYYAMDAYAKTCGAPEHTVRDVSAPSKLGHASLTVNGTLNLSNSGALYTTSHGGAIISNGTGKINFYIAGKSENKNLYECWKTYGKKEGGTALAQGESSAAAGQVQVGKYTYLVNTYYIYGTPVECNPAKLRNGDNSFLPTANAVSGDKFIYSKNLDKWLKNPKTVTWNANGGTSELESMAYSEGAFVGVLPTATREGYTFNGWFTAASGGSQISETTKVTANVEYFAHWTPKQYDITYMDQGKVAFSGTHIDTPNAPHPTKHTYGTATTLNGATKTGYTFGGWHTISNCKESSRITSIGATAICHDITLYAKWTINTHTLTWVTDGDPLTGDYTHGEVAYGTPIVQPNTPTKPGFVFVSWNTSIAATMPDEDVTYTAVFAPQTEEGPFLDIVNWTADSLTLNLNGIPAAGWPYKINGITYYKDKASAGGSPNYRAADRTLTIPYSGNADGTLYIVVNSGATVYSCRPYKIPHINIFTDVDENSVVYVNSGTLTVNSTIAVNAVYVAPGAELVVNSGVTLTVDSIMLRTTPWEAAILDNQGTIAVKDQAYYTRIIADNSKYYQFAIPLSSDVNNVRLSNSAKCTYNTSWMLKSYEEALRANNGSINDETHSNWKLLTTEVGENKDNGVVVASKGYEMFSNTPYYREYYFPVTLPASPTTQVSVSCTKPVGKTEQWYAANSGWNALCSPLLSKYEQNFGDHPEDALKVSELISDGHYWQHPSNVIYPAVPFYYQVPQTGVLHFDDKMTIANNAPRRAWNTSVPTQWLQLTIQNQDGVQLDQASIYTHPEKFVMDYESGYDVMKQSLEGGKALLYSELPCGKLAFAAVPDSLAETRIPLTAYAATDGEYIFSMVDNNYLGRLQYVFLHDTQTGLVVDLLERDCAVNLAQGTNAGRFYIQCVFAAEAPEISTGVNHLEKENDKAQKIIYNDKVYIIYQGRVYDMTGRQCELR